MKQRSIANGTVLRDRRQVHNPENPVRTKTHENQPDQTKKKSNLSSPKENRSLGLKKENHMIVGSIQSSLDHPSLPRKPQFHNCSSIKGNSRNPDEIRFQFRFGLLHRQQNHTNEENRREISLVSCSNFVETP